ncbi:MAG: metalloregulator ArsR/SmtB family transcription factor [Lachnospiraceae bacterium]|nr:metalloregulator ArsR/SmtB family transcription factor [Lachnospiraceae bacterium]
MILDIFYDSDTEVIVSYHPAWELFFSMHVLSNPAHHAARQKWAAAKEQAFPELTRQIRLLGELTNAWTLIVDGDRWGELRQMEIVELLAYLEKMNLYQWNDLIRYSGKTMDIGERNRILEVTRQYYDACFQREELFYRAYLKRLLEKEAGRCREMGLWEWCRQIHPRLSVEEDALFYRKNREYRFEKAQIRTVYLTASTFLSPHLWLYHSSQTLEIVKTVLLEQAAPGIPKDFVLIFRALGDETRLRIIQYLVRGVCTTKNLAAALAVSEAAVSKHLSLLRQAGLVQKRRDGLSVKYEFEMDVIDFLPYTFCEIMMNASGTETNASGSPEKKNTFAEDD